MLELDRIMLENQDSPQVLSRLQHCQISIVSGPEVFCEEFIQQDGLNKLIQLFRFGKWQIQAVALDCLPKLFEYQSTLAQMNKNTVNYTLIYEKIAETRP